MSVDLKHNRGGAQRLWQIETTMVTHKVEHYLPLQRSERLYYAPTTIVPNKMPPAIMTTSACFNPPGRMVLVKVIVISL